MIKPTNLTENGKGWTLWKWGRRIELWYFRTGIPAHIHQGQRVEVIPLWGQSKFYRLDPVTHRRDYVRIDDWLTCFKSYTIPAGWPHWFEGGPVLFINITKGQSPAHNYAFYGRHS